jgi:flagellar protein FliJ
MPSDTNWGRLKDLALHRREACARRLADTIARCTEAQRKLGLLVDYRREYLARMDAASRAGIHGDGLRNYRTFLANLERAIEQQTDAMTGMQRELHAAQRAYADEQRSVDSFDVLQTRADAAGATRERREQQKQQDEFATRPLPRFLTGAD